MKKYFIILLATTFIFGACKKEDELKELSMIIEGVVFDIETGAPLDGAIVKLTTQEETFTDTTDAYGIFSLGEFSTGTYVVFVSKPGYTTEMISPSSSSLAVNEKTEQTVFSAEVELTPLNQTASCTVFKFFKESHDVIKAAANVNYEISWEGFDGKIKGKTNGNGLLSVDSLPYNTNVEIEFDFSEAGIIYKEVFGFSTGDNLSQINIYGYESTGQFAFVSSNTLNANGYGVENFAKDGEVYVSFSQPVDTNSAQFRMNETSYDVAWSQNNMRATLIMDPALSFNTGYNLQIIVGNSTKTQFINNYIYFITEKKPVVIEGLPI